MFQTWLKTNMDAVGLKSQAKFVEFGYGQVEPNQLSAQKTGQIYAQLPAAPAIDMLEQGQFVKYDYAANDNGIGEVNFTGKGEWMMVYNEIKLYRNHIDGSKQWDCEFAMRKDDYQARVWSPYDYEAPELEYHDWHRLNGTDEHGNTSITVERFFSIDPEGQSVSINGDRYMLVDDASETYAADGVKFMAGDKVKEFTYDGVVYKLNADGTTEVKVPAKYEFDDVTADTPDIYEFNWTNDPWKRLGIEREKKMPKGTTMVPRVFKTNVGDIMTTNCVDEDTLAIGDILAPSTTNGILCKSGDLDAMKWQVVKIYTMPDTQRAVKVMRIA